MAIEDDFWQLLLTTIAMSRKRIRCFRKSIFENIYKIKIGPAGVLTNRELKA